MNTSQTGSTVAAILVMVLVGCVVAGAVACGVVTFVMGHLVRP
jgi:hypothetical protein